MKLTNPYVTSNPVGGTSQFIGRKEILDEVFTTLAKPRANLVVLYGRRRIGKTSILMELKRNLSDDVQYIAVYFDLQDYSNSKLNHLLRNLATAIVEAINPEQSRQHQLTGLTPTEHTFYDRFLPEVLEELPSNTSLVLLLDEFDALDIEQEKQQGEEVAEEKKQRREQVATIILPYLRRLTTLNQQQLKFAFVVGREVSDLSPKALSLFKAATSLRVSLFKHDETVRLVNLSANSLQWEDAAITTVWELTHGHPYLTQQLCATIWDQAHSQNGQASAQYRPVIKPKMVHDAVAATLKKSEGALEWVWRGLSLYERAVASAIAERTEAGSDVISQKQLETTLSNRNAEQITRYSRSTAEKLIEWDLLEKAPGGYRLTIELIRKWLIERKPLASVIVEALEQLNPLANHHYQLAMQFHAKGQLENAAHELDYALLNNANHVPARLLLGQILLNKGEITEAVRELDKAYQLGAPAAKPFYTKALLDLAESDNHSFQERWGACQRILDEIQPQHHQALKTQKSLPIEFLNQAHTDQEEGEWDNAIDIYEELLQVFPKAEKRPLDQRKKSWEERLSRCKLEKLYQQAKLAWQEERLDDAQQLLFGVLHQEPNHKNAKQLLDRIRKSDSIPYRLVGTALIVVFLLIAVGFWRFYSDRGIDPSTATSTPSEAAVSIVETPTAAITEPVPPTATESPEPSTLTPTVPVATPTPTVPVATPTLTVIIVAPTIVELPTPSGERHRGQVFSVAFSPDGTRLASGGAGGEIFLWNIKNERSELLVDLGVNVDVSTVAFNSDGRPLAYGSSDGRVCLWDVNRKKTIQECFNFSARAQSVIFSPDGKRLAAGASDGTIRLWEIENNNYVLRHEEQDPGAVQSLSFSADGTDQALLASGGPRGTIRLWDVKSGKLSQLSEPSGWVVYSVAFSSVGRLASGSEDGTVRVWDVANGKVLHTLSGHENSVEGVAFSPDGQLLASASLDGTVRLWDVANGTLLKTLEPKQEVYSVAFNHDGTHLACGLKDGTIRLWRLSSP